MEETTAPKTPKAPYRKHGKAVWDLARERYLAGESARQVSEALGMTEWAIRMRIQRQGWSKQALAEAVAGEVVAKAQADAAAGAVGLAAPAGADDEAALDPRAAARAALDEAVRLMRGGRMAAAAEAARVADVMARAAARLDGDGPGDPGEPDEAAFEAVRRKVLGWGPDDLPLPMGEGGTRAEGVGG